MGWRSIAVAVIFGMRLFSASSKCDRARTIRALFVGNTFIYVNNVPKLVEGIAAGLPGPCIETGITAIGGATLETARRRCGVRRGPAPSTARKVHDRHHSRLPERHCAARADVATGPSDHS